MAKKKRERVERLFVFELKLWDVTVRVADRFADAARRLLMSRHHFLGAWESATVENLGWDDGSGWRARAKKGGDIISVVSAPKVVTPPQPETALLSGEADDHSADADRD
ncbi:MAG: hypothetical protein Q7R85_02595 [bacterium]|nr:hypothetical protein [bacterium]